MRLTKLLFVLSATGAALATNAETRTITGQGAVTNAAGAVARFSARLGQVDNNAATGRFQMTWAREGVSVTVLTENPRVVLVDGRIGKMEGRAVASVTRNGETRRWEGIVRVTAWDLKNSENPNGRDKLRMRFIRNPWESPEGDFYFEGAVTDGGLEVKKV